jgi:Fe-S cluster assembly protein SufD
MTTMTPGTHSTAQAADPAWVRALRDTAASSFAQRGFPTTREEAWRYTSLADVAATAWRRAEPGLDAPASDRAIPLDSPWRITLVNGVPVSIDTPAGSRAVIRSLREAIDDPAESPHVRAHLGTVSRGDTDDAMAMLNTSVLDDGLYIRIPRSVAIADPILLIHHTVPQGNTPVSVYPRTLILVEDGASVNLVEHALGAPDADRSLTCAVTEVVVGASARCDHTLIQDEPDHAVHMNTRRAVLGDAAHFGSHTLILGGRLTRNAIAPTLNGEGGHTILTGIYLARSGQHADTAIRVDHAKPNCFSRQFYRGLAGEAGRGVFTGRIVVHLDAQKTDAIQSSSGLLLAPTGHITTRPQLEIYADDVRCTHGSTIGQLDDDAIFYLRARGIPEAEARAMLVRAFIADIIDRFPDEPVRAWAMDRLSTWLDEGTAVARA